MSGVVLSASPDTPLTEATQMMLSQKRKWMVVVDSDGKAIGLVDRQVLLKSMLHQSVKFMSAPEFFGQRAIFQECYPNDRYR
jgi:CBS-domain-containing membrane protein